MNFPLSANIYRTFVVSNASGGAISADALPTAQLIRNGALVPTSGGGSVAVTVGLELETGVYPVSFTMPGNWNVGDYIQVLVRATIGGVNAKTVKIEGWVDVASNSVLTRLGTPVGASVVADIASNKTVVDAINTKLGTPVASVSTDIASNKTVVDTINTKLGTPVANVSTDISNVKSDTNTINTKLGTPVANVSTDIATSKTAIDGINTKLGTPVGASISADIASKHNYTVQEIADAIWQYVIESDLTAEEAMRLYASILAGKLNIAGNNSMTFRDVNDTKDRVVATVDVRGNRLSVTKDLA